MNPKTYPIDRNPWLERLVLFVVSFAFWLCLVWPYSAADGRWLPGDIVAGIPVSIFVALVMGEMIRANLIRLLNPRSWFWLLVYQFVFAYYVIKGGLDVAYRVLHPAVPIQPGIVRIRSILQTETGRTVLACAITLTPGTLTIDVSDDGVFYIHWLNVGNAKDEATAKRVMRRFEWYIKRIFE
jgi:multicomponent Na+:H+ antiporter subunit E